MKLAVLSMVVFFASSSVFAQNVDAGRQTFVARCAGCLASGGRLEGLVLNQGADDLQLLGDDRKIHLLRKEGNRYRAVTSQSDWPSYHGGAQRPPRNPPAP